MHFWSLVFYLMISRLLGCFDQLTNALILWQAGLTSIRTSLATRVKAFLIMCFHESARARVSQAISGQVLNLHMFGPIDMRAGASRADMLRKACGAALGIQWSLAHETEVDLAADLLYRCWTYCIANHARACKCLLEIPGGATNMRAVLDRDVVSACRAITTGAGLPTLGEEFSEIIQVSKTREGHFISPGPLLRAQLVALECIGPYLSQKAILALSREHESQSSSHPVPRAMTGASDAQPFPATLSRSAEPTEPTRSHRRGSRASTSGLPGPKPAPPVPRALSEIPYWIVAVALHHARSVPRPLGTLVTLVQQWCSSLRASLSAGPYWLRRLARSLPTLLGAMSRLHLAAFYLHGDFLGVAKRIAGVRYAYVGRPLEPLPTYRILGERVECVFNDWRVSVAPKATQGCTLTTNTRVGHPVCVCMQAGPCCCSLCSRPPTPVRSGLWPERVPRWELLPS